MKIQNSSSSKRKQPSLAKVGLVSENPFAIVSLAVLGGILVGTLAGGIPSSAPQNPTGAPAW